MGSSEHINRDRRNESGNVLFFILIGVVLFAALSYTVSNMMRGGSAETIQAERAKVLAGEIIDYTRSLRQGIQTLRISNGCADNEISFQNAVVAGYTNGTNAACQIFNASGGDVHYVPPNKEALDIITPAPILYGEWYFTAGVCVQGVGTPAAGCSVEGREIVAILPYVNLKTCQVLNEILGVTAAGANPPVEHANAWATTNVKFTGNFTHGGTQMEQAGRLAGCFEGNSDTSTPPEDTYHFYQVLVAR